MWKWIINWLIIVGLIACNVNTEKLSQIRKRLNKRGPKTLYSNVLNYESISTQFRVPFRQRSVQINETNQHIKLIAIEFK